MYRCDSGRGRARARAFRKKRTLLRMIYRAEHLRCFISDIAFGVVFTTVFLWQWWCLCVYMSISWRCQEWLCKCVCVVFVLLNLSFNSIHAQYCLFSFCCKVLFRFAFISLFGILRCDILHTVNAYIANRFSFNMSTLSSHAHTPDTRTCVTSGCIRISPFRVTWQIFEEFCDALRSPTLWK